jgi:osmotically-inducible protein OsmY
MTLDARSDAQIARDIHEALRWDTRLEADAVAVAVAQGVVTLSGHVRLLAEVHAAADDAWRVQGVRRVDNLLSVNPAGERTDDEVVTDLLRRLQADTRVDLGQLAFHVAAGVVTVRGVVPSTRSGRAVVEAAWHTPGVIAVVNGLEVSPDQRRPDGEIRDDLIQALVRDARITDATAIDVTVDGGDAILTGTVDRPAERQAAEAAAYFTAGVHTVTNRLQLRTTDEPSVGDRRGGSRAGDMV